MKKVFTNLSFALLTCVLLVCCRSGAGDPLPSWNDTEIKHRIVHYIADEAQQIPVENRIAVFDMDGTIACEAPLWFEMYVAVYGMVCQLEKNPALIELVEYQYAKKLYDNPADTSVLNNWVVGGVNYLDSIILKAFKGTDYEAYVDTAHSYLAFARDRKYDIALEKMFYQPMLELLDYLKKNDFSIYIVSGSMQGVIWSICPQVIGFDREHLIGTRQVLTPLYENGKTSFIANAGIHQPKNDGNGKSLNIYSHIGKIPVFAFGNTTGDFGMFHLASTSRYPHIALLLNHDDDEREYAYPPYHGASVPGWQDSLRVNGWEQVDMSKEFKTVWMTR
ncbi:MAG: haloacid dehalogenase-like hydrolase [Prevotellaceae bacterium]|nr:haloacid dehalogenase-like hydrolase [Prevotellaceae bacterium]